MCSAAAEASFGKPTIDAFEVYNDFDRNLVNLFRCMKERTMATIRELGFVISTQEKISLRSANSLTTRHSMTSF